MAKTIMLQGTSSDVGKSVLVAALCRIFWQDGYQVAPFKGQNMASNSYVTMDGGEMGRAQVVQAEAAKIQPTSLMNPVLLKPTEDAASQVIILGEPMGNLSAREYHNQYKDRAWQIIKQSLEQLNAQYEILVIEGAGSPAEVNLKANDVVNMRVAKEIKAPVLLIADIDRGGALASIVGTLELLDPEERDLVQGLIINKFRGDINLLKPALDFLEEKTGKPVLGVIPYFQQLGLPEEDSLAIEHFQAKAMANSLDIAIIHLPHMANFTDFDALAAEEDVSLRYIKSPDEFGQPDLIILPGSKNIVTDLDYLKSSGLNQALQQAALKDIPIIGISGGLQILGSKISIGANTYQGLDFLKLTTQMDEQKSTTQIKAQVLADRGLLENCLHQEVEGYQIHRGQINITGKDEQPLRIIQASGQAVNSSEGSLSPSGWIWGTHIHGVFDNDVFRRQILNNLRALKGWSTIEKPTFNATLRKEKAFNDLAQLVKENIDLNLLYQIMGL